MNPRVKHRFFAAVERTAAAAKVPAAVGAALAEPAAAAPALVRSPERETRFPAETLAVAPVAGALPGAARREIEVEPAALLVEAAAEGTAE